MREGHRESRCGKCGYIVKGSTTMTCPECGSDLREVGILPSSIARRSLVWRLILLATSLMVFSALCICFYMGLWTDTRDALSQYVRSKRGQIFLRLEVGAKEGRSFFSDLGAYEAYIDKHFWPYSGHSRHTVTLSPVSKAYRQLVLVEEREIRIFGRLHALDWDGDGSTDGETRFEIHATVEPLTGEPRPLKIDALRNLACRYTTSAGTVVARAAPPDCQFILEWMRDAGVDATSKDVEREADAMLKIILTSVREEGIGYSWNPDKPVDRPVGRLETIVYSAKGLDQEEKYPFDRHIGSKSVEFGPPFSVRWVGVPLTLVLWVAGSCFIVRRWPGRPATVNRTTPSQETNSSAADAMAGSRTLTIMFTDIKDYTKRTAGESRAGVIEMVRRHHDLVEPIVRNRGGRIVKQIGDALLVAFESATDGVLSGVEIQAALAQHNHSASTEREKFELRIGVSTGEVTLEQNDVYGEPVNLASRVQQLGKPEQVLFSEATLVMIKQQEVVYSELGSFELKGVGQPVKIYVAEPGRT